MRALELNDVSASVSRSGSGRQDVPALTGLRFVAAFSVLIGHGFSWILHNHETPGGVVFWVSQIAGLGMTLFFVLSGFVIHYNYGNLVTKGLRGTAAFFWARFARLYPLFLLMMLVYVILSSRTLDLLMVTPRRFGSILRALPYFVFSIHSWVYTLIDGNPCHQRHRRWLADHLVDQHRVVLLSGLSVNCVADPAGTHSETCDRTCPALVRSLDCGDERPL